MREWPPIDEPELLDRLAMDGGRFEKFLRELAASVPARTFEPESLARAIGYPWARPPGSYRLADGEVELLADLDDEERERLVERFVAGAGRLPLLAIGSNAAPEALERKFAHFSEAEDRALLALTGRLHDFDVGVAPQPTIYGSMPATLFPSTGTEMRTTVLWVTPAQFTQLVWSELTYRLGRLQTRFDADDGGTSFDEVLVFVSRFGSFCLDGEPVALAAIEAERRTALALTQEELLDAAAVLALGPGAKAETLVRAIYEDMSETFAKVIVTVRKASVPFATELWTPWRPPDDGRLEATPPIRP